VRYGWIADTHCGTYDQPVVSRERAAAFSEELLAEVVRAETLGLDGIFVPERHARSETLVPSPLTAIAAMAAVTDRVLLAPYVLQPVLYDPVHLAEQTAQIDVLSRGRFVLAVGLGYHDTYVTHFGRPLERRLGRYVEALDVVERAWQGERFDFDGEFLTTRGTLVPRPYQEPRPPIWYAAMAEKPVRRAARRGDALALAALNTPVPVLRAVADRYREECDRVGRPARIAVSVTGFVGESLAHARETFARHWVDDIRYYMRWGMLRPNEEFPDLDSVTVERLEPHLVLGDAEECRQRVEFWREALGLTDDDWFIFRSRLPQGPSHEDTMASLERFATAVVPAVTAGAPGALTSARG
jgi:alkanesulfonate monooxygenase SsuD/methylene tetrahydromethanopterin reductase-like flavin-dependent oxidoreductase (luciferase family)